jgi:terminase large subunit-like protein
VVDKMTEAFWRKVGYAPHTQQRLYHESRARFRVPCCGRRFGKSTMAARDVTPRVLLKPHKMVWIVGPTYDLAEKEFRVIWNDLIVNQGLGKDKRVKRSYSKRAGDMFIQFPWDTRVECRSAEHPEYLVGEALDHVIMSEAAKHKKETWERYIRPALADRRGSADFPTTPEGFNWLHDLWQLGRRKKFEGIYESWRFPSWSNSVVYPGGRDDEEIQLLEETSEPEWFLQEIGADFASFVGKIFPDWDETQHVLTEDYKFIPDWPNYIAFDWGFTNPLAAVEFQVSPQDEIFVWREHYKKYKTIPDHISLMMAREQPPGYHINLTFGDPADPEAAEQVTREFGKRGIHVQCMAPRELKSDYTWRDGIDLMSEFMKPVEIHEDKWGAPISAPRYRVAWECKNHIRELNNYRSTEPVKGRNVPELGNKVEDHTIDATRYALLCLFKMGAHNNHLDPLMVTSSGPVELTPQAAARRTLERTVAQDFADLMAGQTGGYFNMTKEL